MELDPNYAPAWSELGQRYYYDATYSKGGEQMFQRSNAALERALALDPNSSQRPRNSSSTGWTGVSWGKPMKRPRHW